MIDCFVVESDPIILVTCVQVKCGIAAHCFPVIARQHRITPCHRVKFVFFEQHTMLRRTLFCEVSRRSITFLYIHCGIHMPWQRNLQRPGESMKYKNDYFWVVCTPFLNLKLGAADNGFKGLCHNAKKYSCFVATAENSMTCSLYSIEMHREY
jgi:hypothetical protein